MWQSAREEKDAASLPAAGGSALLRRQFNGKFNRKSAGKMPALPNNGNDKKQRCQRLVGRLERGSVVLLTRPVH
jgi:hypothetical protein